MKYLQVSLIIVAIIGIYLFSITETFENMDSLTNKRLNPDKYPSDVLLADWYPKHQPKPTISNLNEENQYKNYPVFSAHSTKINNLKQWRKPNNGKCSPAELCGNFYEDLDVTLPTPAIRPGFNKGIRVNFFNIN
jgi:hypothetical protein